MKRFLYFLFILLAFLFQGQIFALASTETIKYQFLCSENGNSVTPKIEVNPEGFWEWEVCSDKEGVAIYYCFYISPNIGVQIGSKNAPYKTATFTHAYTENISKVTLETATTSKGDSEVKVFIGETQIGETLSLNASKNSKAKEMTEYEFVTTEPISGEIRVCYERLGNNTNSQAIYLNSISITKETSLSSTEVCKPIFSHSDGVYDKPFELSISADNADIFYTTDGSDSKNGNLYQGAIPLNVGTTTIRATAKDKAGNFSEEATATYTILGNNPSVSAEYTSATLEDLENGGYFLLASESNLSNAWVVSKFTNNKLVSTKDTNEYNFVHIFKEQDYFRMTLLKEIGVIQKEGTDLSSSQNLDWNITAGEESGQFIIINKEYNEDSPRALLFVVNDGNVKYFRSSNLTGYSNYIYILKEKTTSGVPHKELLESTPYYIYNITGQFLFRCLSLKQAKSKLECGLYIINGQKVFIK